MNRIVIIVLLGSLFCLTGCIEVNYKSEARLTLGKKKPSVRPRIVDNGYPYSPKPLQANLISNESIRDTYIPNSNILERKSNLETFGKWKK